MPSTLSCKKCGKETRYDGSFGGAPCEYCGYKLPHIYVLLGLLPFLLYFSALGTIELIFAPPIPDELKILGGMAGLILLWYLYAQWSQRKT
tara:strand:+ start:411 stop:683 length:273 start_codon:yes stop_codon:yes gene_type:complete